MSSEKVVDIVVAALVARGYSQAEALTMVRVLGGGGAPVRDRDGAALAKLRQCYDQCLVAKQARRQRPFVPPWPIEIALQAIKEYLAALAR